MTDNNEIIQATQRWVETVVVGLTLCPFAKQEVDNDTLLYSVSEATTEEALLMDLQLELDAIVDNAEIETSLLIHPNVLQNFYDYNQFLDYAEALLFEMELEGVYQIASFHPDYQFAGTEPGDTRNYTNKSPYPMLHIIAEDSISNAVADFPDAELVPERNKELLKILGKEKMEAARKACFIKD